MFHLKLNFDCTVLGTVAGRTLTKVLSQTPAGESVAIRITDLTHSKQYSYQALHALPSAIVAEQLPQMGASIGQALMWDGTKWWPDSVGTGNGSVTTINTGTGLTGGPISTSGTISIANLGVGTAELANNSVTAAKINAGEITNSHISGTAAIDYAKLNIGVGEIPQDRINGLSSAMTSLIEDVINDAVTGKAPSQNAVYDALALKADRSNITQNITAASVTGLTAPIAGSDAANKTFVDNAVATVDTRVTTEVATLNTSIGNKYDKSGGVITGDVTLNTQLHLKGGANTVTVKANAGTANYVLTLPTSVGTSGYVLATDGSGNTSWVTPAVGSSSITDGSIVDADVNASAGIAQSKISNLTTDLAGKQPLIPAGTNAQYYRGDKTFVDLGTDVRGTALTGFAVGANSTVVATDTTLAAFQKVQGQIDATNTAVAGKEASLTAGSTSQYYRGDKSWQTLNGAVVANTAAGNIAATNVQSALNELDTEKQDKLTSASIMDSRELRFYELPGNGTSYSSLKSPDDLTGNINYTLPFVAPTAGQVLSSSAAGVMSWITIPSAPVTTVHGRSGAVVSANGDYSASQITNTPAGTIAATTVQAALNELDGDKQATITAGTTAQYYRGDKTWATFATDAINSVLSTFALNGGAKPAVTNTDTVVGAFGKVQKTLNDINADYVSKTADQTINGNLKINSLTGFITVPDPILGKDAANKDYVDSFGKWIKNVTDIYYNGGSVAVGATSVNASAVLELSSTSKGFLPPRMTTAERDAIASPAAGLIIFNTTLAKVEFYTGSGWVQSGQDQTCTTLYNSCAGIKAANSSSSSGTYLIDPDGGGAIQPMGVYCDMTTSNGGWTLVSAATDGNYFASTAERDSYDINNPTPTSNKFSILDKTDTIAGGGNGTQRQYLYIDRRTSGNRWIVVQQTNSLNSSSITGFSLINSSHAPNMSYLSGFGTSASGNAYYDGNVSNWIWAIAQRSAYTTNGYVTGIYADGTQYTDNLSTGYAFFVKPSSNSSYQSCTQSPWLKINSSTAYMEGNVGIGTTSPVVKLDVSGSIRPGSSGVAIGGACTGEGSFAYDLSAHAPVYCSNSGLWTSMGGGGLGVGQTWQNVSASRTWNTTYTNSTGKPIQVQIGVVNSGATDTTATTATVDGVQVVYTGEQSNRRSTFSFIVPNGSTYSIAYGTTGGPVSIAFWSELR